jgi:cytochrome c oxidase cbb3-type subunit 3
VSDQDKLREHEYDGIREFDNRLPNWWLWTLYGAIVFALGYWLFFHTWRLGNLPRDAYAAEMAVAAEAQLARMAGQELTDETLLLMSQVPERVAAGGAVFGQICATCHRPDASGDIGPNLTDGYWIHGGSPLQIHHTVTNGVPDKGMVAWMNQLGPQRIQDVVAYLITLRGRNLSGKAPQGLDDAGQPAPGWAQQGTG